MMLGHLTIAGLAELVLSAGVVAFLQRTDPSLLKLTAPGVSETQCVPESGWRATRPLWAALAMLMVLSPLGILAAGAAWGEWVASDFADPAIRQQMAAVSSNQAPPDRAPQGLERLSSLVDRARRALCASVCPQRGVRLFSLCLVRRGAGDSGRGRDQRGRYGTQQLTRAGFIERSIDGLYEAMERALYAEDVASGGGLLQRLDPRVKVAGLLALIAAAALAAKLGVILAVFAVAVVLAALSRISVATLATRVWLGALTFTGAIAVPAIFLTPGRVVYSVPVVGWPVTAQGLTTAAYLILRVETAATLSLLLVFTTPWTHVLKALRVFRAPVVFVVVLGMTCRYILLMLETAHEMFDSRKSRTVGTLPPARKQAAGRFHRRRDAEQDVPLERRSVPRDAGPRLSR